MAKYRQKSVVIEAITFDEFIEYGKSNAEDKSFEDKNGMPWSFNYNGHQVTHEDDECYLIPAKTGIAHFTPADMLIVTKDEIYPCPTEVFREKYEKEECIKGKTAVVTHMQIRPIVLEGEKLWFDKEHEFKIIDESTDDPGFLIVSCQSGKYKVHRSTVSII